LISELDFEKAGSLLYMRAPGFFDRVVIILCIFITLLLKSEKEIFT